MMNATATRARQLAAVAARTEPLASAVGVLIIAVSVVGMLIDGPQWAALILPALAVPMLFRLLVIGSEAVASADGQLHVLTAEDVR